MCSAKFRTVTIYFTWCIYGMVASETPEDVPCKTWRENRTTRIKEFFPKDHQKLLTQREVRTVECDFDKNSGYTYNLIGRKFSSLYNLYEKRNASKIKIYQDSLRDYFNGCVDENCHVEVAFFNCDWQLLPSEFDTISSRISSINVTNCELAIVDKVNLMQLGDNLRAANFSNNNLMFITKDLFTYNKNLKYCDFSDNPLKHIDAFYFDQETLLVAMIEFNFEHVNCIDNITSEAEEIRSSSYNSINCTNPSFVINYTSLEYHLTRQPEETILSCSIENSCINFSQKKSRFSPRIFYNKMYTLYDCKMEVSYARTLVSKSVQYKVLKYQFGSEKCNEVATKISLTFIEVTLEFIPNNLIDVTQIQVDNLRVVRVNFFQSMNTI